MNKFTPKSSWPPSSVADRDYQGSDDLMVREQPKTVVRFGYVKWYDHDRKFGFIVDENTGKDNFVHWVTLKRNNVKPIDLKEESRVKFTSRTPDKNEGVRHFRDEIVTIEILS